MAFVDTHLLVQTVVYICTFLSGFVVSIPIGITNIRFSGTCMLYGNFDWRSQMEFTMTSSDYLNCNFSIYLNVIGCIFYSLCVGAYNVYALHKSRTNPLIASQMWVLPFILLNSLMTIFVLVSSCIITVGFAGFCNGLTEKELFSSCAEGQNFDWKNAHTGEVFNVGNYYELLTLAKIASWVSFLLWLGQTSLGILRFVRNRRQRAKSTTDRTNIGNVEPTA